jgi:hypothetical protein
MMLNQGPDIWGVFCICCYAYIQENKYCTSCCLFFLLQNVRKSEACRWGWNFHQKDIPQLTSNSSQSRTWNAGLVKLSKEFLRQMIYMSTDFKARYVSVIHFCISRLYFMISNFYWLDSWQSLWCLHFVCESTMKHPQKLDWKSDNFWFSYGRWKRMNVGFLTEYIGPLHWVQSWVCRTVLQFEDVFLSLLWHVCLVVFCFGSSVDYTSVKCRCTIKSSNQITPAYLSW